MMSSSMSSLDIFGMFRLYQHKCTFSHALESICFEFDVVDRFLTLHMDCRRNMSDHVSRQT